MERNQTDSDAGSQSSVGVGQVDAVTKLLHEIQPNWLADGYGLRGPQQVKEREVAARPEPMQFGLPPSAQKASDSPGEATPCAPKKAPSSGTHLWGSVGGVCQWIDTTTCT